MPATLTVAIPEIVTGGFIMTALAALIAPLIRYPAIGWRAKRKDIMDGMSAYARFAYFQMFSRSDTIPKPSEASANFEKLYSHWYGRLFCVPVILFALVGLIAVGLVILTVVTERGYLPKNPLFTLPATAVSAIAGAYLWVLNDHISRARRGNFSPSDVSWGSLRIIISIPMGYAFASIDQWIGSFVAFALGAFPLTELQSMLLRLANKRLQLNGTPEETRGETVKLQGINKDIAEQLADGLLGRFYAEYSSGQIPDLATRTAQIYLSYLGYSPAVDGRTGPAARAAVSAFRAKSGVGEGSDIDEELLSALKDALAGSTAP